MTNVKTLLYICVIITPTKQQTMQFFEDIPSRDIMKAEALSIVKPFTPSDTEGFTLPDVVLDFLALASSPHDFSRRFHAAHHSKSCHEDKGDFATNDFITTMHSTYQFLTKE